jgi:hypothetical protein
LLAVFIVGCDKGYSATIRNDLDQDVIVKYAFDSERLIDEGGGPLHPGRFASVGEVNGPGLRPKLLLKAFDLQGLLVFCRRLEYEAYRDTSKTAPVSIRSGYLSCD